MPTDTFYRLPQQKRDRLLAAIHGELSRVPVTELSVNRIVHEAGISRGSFYQYLRDRDDLVQYLLEYVDSCIHGFITAAAPACGGDPFELLRRFLSSIRAFGDDPVNRAFCTNLLAHLRANGGVQHCRSNAFSPEWIEGMFDRYFDRSRLNLAEPEDFKLMTELMQTVLQGAVAALFMPGADADALERAFDRKLLILQRGMLKKEAQADAC